MTGSISISIRIDGHRHGAPTRTVIDDDRNCTVKCHIVVEVAGQRASVRLYNGGESVHITDESTVRQSVPVSTTHEWVRTVWRIYNSVCAVVESTMSSISYKSVPIDVIRCQISFRVVNECSMIVVRRIYISVCAVVKSAMSSIPHKCVPVDVIRWQISV